MPNRLIVERRALTEIDKAYAWYEAREPGLGLDFAHEVDSVLDLIKDQPELCTILHRNIRRAGLHRFPYGVFYVHRGNDVRVVAVLHSSRHPGSWLRRR